MRKNLAKRMKVGILGGGQLAQMLAEAALRLGLEPIAYTDDPDGPASHRCPIVNGTLGEKEKLKRFVSSCDAVVFENEFVDCATLRASSADREKFSPSFETIELLQDKLNQKYLLSRLSIPTSPFLELSAAADPLSEIERALDSLNGPVVLKWAKLGYDGKGVRFVDRPTVEAREFILQARVRGFRVYAESRVDFVRELAVVACLSKSGDFVAYPLVISEQERGICKKVKGPASLWGVPPGLEIQSRDFAQRVGKESKLIGAFALEFFETRLGELWVNEIAPRVHNTGHYTQDSCPVSQFENHWNAVISGRTLSDPSTSSCFGMFNILGPPGLNEPDGGPPHELASTGKLHWYGKKEIRPGRKLGHVNCVAGSKNALEAELAAAENGEKAWINRLLKASQELKRDS